MLAIMAVRSRQNDQNVEDFDALRIRTGPRKVSAGERASVARRRDVSRGRGQGETRSGIGASAKYGRALPRPRRELVPRPRLARALLDDRSASTVLLCAPPGYGKTTLLKDWSERDARPSAWVTLTDQHCSATLLEAIVLALNDLEPVERGLLSECRAEARKRPASVRASLLAALSSTLSAMGTERDPALLILDDAHLPTGRGVQQVLSTVVAATPDCAKVGLASRSKTILPSPAPARKAGCWSSVNETLR